MHVITSSCCHPVITFVCEIINHRALDKNNQNDQRKKVIVNKKQQKIKLSASDLKSLVKRMIDDAQNCITEKYSISNRFSPQQNNCTYI